MATYATQSITTAGVAASYTAVASADRFLPADHCFLHVKNGGGSSITVTVVTPGTQDGLAIADRTVTISAGTDQMIAIPPAFYRSSDGLGDVQYSAITSVTAAVLLV